MKKTIIFDFDGTIANTLPFHFKKVQEIINKHKITGLDSKKVVAEIRSKTPQELLKEFKISWLKFPFILSVVRKAQKELNNVIDQIEVFPGMKKTLFELKKKYQIGILSSNIPENIDKFLSINKLEIFDFIYCERNVFGKDKSLNNLIKKYSLLKKDVYYVGDEVRDIEACKKAKIKIIAVGWGFHHKKLLLENHPDYFVEKPIEIINYFK
jgi:phosphoglycolate phosphatase